MQKEDAIKKLKEGYHLEKHLEGGWFSEIYTSSITSNDGRPIAGSIYLLLIADEISHFHKIDCDEIWYYHAGCGVRIITLDKTGKKENLLGINPKNNEHPSVIVPKGTIFAAENIDKKSYSFVSCATFPKFKNEGLCMICRAELRKDFSVASKELANYFDYPKF